MKITLPVAMTAEKKSSLDEYINSCDKEIPFRKVINWNSKYNKIKNYFRNKNL